MIKNANLANPSILQKLWMAIRQDPPALPDANPCKDAGLLLKRHGNSILRTAFSYVHNLSDAEDILQDTLLQYLKKAPHFTSESHEKAWLLRVAINLSKNWLKRGHLHPQEPLSALLPDIPKDSELFFVWDAVKALPPQYREVVHLYYQEGYCVTEISTLLSKNESTIRTHLSRARALLKDTLKEAYDFDG